MDAIIRIIKPLKNWIVLINGVETDGDETKNHQIQNKKVDFLVF